jgi:hypothetical protein
MGKYLWDTFADPKGLKQGNTLTPLLFTFNLEYAISKAQETWEALKLNGTHQFLIYADIVNSFVENINTIKLRR